MPDISLTSHLVRPEDIDGQGHANNIAYFSWLQSAAVGHSVAQGWTAERYRQHHWAWVVRTHFIEYRRPVFQGDQILIRTWVADMKKFTSLRKYELERDGKLVARAETNWAFVDTETGRLIPVPAEVSQSFQIRETSPRNDSPH